MATNLSFAEIEASKAEQYQSIDTEDVINTSTDKPLEKEPSELKNTSKTAESLNTNTEAHVMDIGGVKTTERLNSFLFNNQLPNTDLEAHMMDTGEGKTKEPVKSFLFDQFPNSDLEARAENTDEVKTKQHTKSFLFDRFPKTEIQPDIAYIGGGKTKDRLKSFLFDQYPNQLLRKTINLKVSAHKKTAELELMSKTGEIKVIQDTKDSSETRPTTCTISKIASSSNHDKMQSVSEEQKPELLKFIQTRSPKQNVKTENGMSIAKIDKHEKEILTCTSKRSRKRHSKNGKETSIAKIDKQEPEILKCVSKKSRKPGYQIEKETSIGKNARLSKSFPDKNNEKKYLVRSALKFIDARTMLSWIRSSRQVDFNGKLEEEDPYKQVELIDIHQPSTSTHIFLDTTEEAHPLGWQEDKSSELLNKLTDSELLSATGGSLKVITSNQQLRTIDCSSQLLKSHDSSDKSSQSSKSDHSSESSEGDHTCSKSSESHHSLESSKFDTISEPSDSYYILESSDSEQNSESSKSCLNQELNDLYFEGDDEGSMTSISDYKVRSSSHQTSKKNMLSKMLSFNRFKKFFLGSKIPSTEIELQRTSNSEDEFFITVRPCSKNKKGKKIDKNIQIIHPFSVIARNRRRNEKNKGRGKESRGMKRSEGLKQPTNRPPSYKNRSSRFSKIATTHGNFMTTTSEPKILDNKSKDEQNNYSIVTCSSGWSLKQQVQSKLGKNDKDKITLKEECASQNPSHRMQWNRPMEHEKYAEKSSTSNAKVISSTSSEAMKYNQIQKKHEKSIAKKLAKVYDWKQNSIEHTMLWNNKAKRAKAANYDSDEDEMYSHKALRQRADGRPQKCFF